jgi:2,4-dienoyl-CoA reductase-like NADH-dependent reductase (Old Yellow Enzyme family)
MLFDPFAAQSLQFKHRTVMPPMTRNRSIGNVPNALMAQYQAPDPFLKVRSQYFALADELSNIGLLYMHVLDHSVMGAPAVPKDLQLGLRERFKGACILAGGFNQESAEKALQANHANLIAFGSGFRQIRIWSSGCAPMPRSMRLRRQPFKSLDPRVIPATQPWPR